MTAKKKVRGEGYGPQVLASLVKLLGGVPVTAAKLKVALGGMQTYGVAKQIRKTDSGPIVLLAPVAYDRIIGAWWTSVTESFADNTGTMTDVVGLGDEDAVDGLYANGAIIADLYDGAYATPRFGISSMPLKFGRLRAGKSLILTATAATGDGTGEYIVAVSFVPVT